MKETCQQWQNVENKFEKIAAHAGSSRGKEGACPETGQTANGCGGAVNALAEVFLSDADAADAAVNALAEIKTSLRISPSVDILICF